MKSMNKTIPKTSWRLTACLLASGLTMGFGWPALSQQAAVEAKPVIEPLIEEPFDDDFDLLLDAKPGFKLQTADEDFQKQMAQLSGFLSEQDWAKAFRLLTELNNEQLQMMVPLDGDGRYVLVKEELQRQLLSLPPDGRRAFRLYFDAQAEEQLEGVKNHPLPGSDEQLALTKALVDRQLASSVGGEAAVMLGDMYFERGLFDQAERSWQLALDEGSATGQQALELQAKRTLAMQRAGKKEQARSLYESLRQRYDKATIKTGGQEVDAIALLGQSIDQQQGPAENDRVADKADLMPAADAMPHWHLTFVDASIQNTINQVRGRNSYYSPPADLMKYVPPVVADKQHIYFLWLDVVFAMDRESGKLDWIEGSVKETAKTFTTRVQSNHGDPRNYSIAISDEILLATAPRVAEMNSPFVLSAYHKESGKVRWSSDTRQDWVIESDGKPQEGSTSVLGGTIIAEGKGYAVVYRAGQSTMFLRCFEPTTGEVAWTIPLGSAEVTAFQYTQVSRVPQPTLLKTPAFLYVMSNNGALLAVDVIAGEVKWALRTEPPFGVGAQQQRNFVRGNQLGTKLESMANTNGSGRLLLQDKTLYAKEHNGKTLYALDPTTGKIKWSADQLKSDAKLIGIDDKRFYLMDRAMQSYAVDGNHDLITKNGAQTGSPDHSGALLRGDKILFYASGKLRQFDTTHLDPAGKYENPDYLGQRGGYLYTFGDLLIAIDSAQITAFKIENKN